MKETEGNKDYTNKLMVVVNKIRLLGEELPNKRVVEKILVAIPEHFEAKISSLEEFKDLSTIILGELVNVLQAQKERRAYRQEETVEGAFQVKESDQNQEENKGKKPKNRRNQKKEGGNNSGGSRRNPPCSHCQKKPHISKSTVGTD